MINEILPGLAHWSAFHEGIGRTVYSGFVLESGTLIDPLEPAEGLDAVAALAAPQRVVLSNRHHYRHSARFTERFDCPVLCHEAGLHAFGKGQPVQGFAFGESLADDVWALELGSICAEETALWLGVDAGVLWFADGLTRAEDGSLAFMPDELLGADPETVRAGLRRKLRSLLDEDFDALLFAHAEPVTSGAHELLSEFLSLSQLLSS
ncbi:MAG TPA: hypothetical protein VLJ42_01985 [Solirubrobacteraceae bacterium]|nr:hypothetical protein [Solirubrobacteraceae bacterium]